MVLGSGRSPACPERGSVPAAREPPQTRVGPEWAAELLHQRDRGDRGPPGDLTLRTTCDLGMRLPRRQAFAGDVRDVEGRGLHPGRHQANRLMRGSAGTDGCASFASWCRCATPEFESPGECYLALDLERRRRVACRSSPSRRCAGPSGSFYLDLAVPELRYAAEYDGVSWHGPAQQPTTTSAGSGCARTMAGSSMSSRRSDVSGPSRWRGCCMPGSSALVDGWASSPGPVRIASVR